MCIHPYRGFYQVCFHSLRVLTMSASIPIGIAPGCIRPYRVHTRGVSIPMGIFSRGSVRSF